MLYLLNRPKVAIFHSLKLCKHFDKLVKINDLFLFALAIRLTSLNLRFCPIRLLHYSCPYVHLEALAPLGERNVTIEVASCCVLSSFPSCMDHLYGCV